MPTGTPFLQLIYLSVKLPLKAGNTLHLVSLLVSYLFSSVQDEL